PALPGVVSDPPVIDLRALLVSVGDARFLAGHDISRVGLELAEQHAQEGGLARAVAADDPDPLAALHDERDPFDDPAVAEALPHLARFDHRMTEPGRSGRLQRRGLRALQTLLRHQAPRPLDARLALCPARLATPRRERNPPRARRS